MTSHSTATVSVLSAFMLILIYVAFLVLGIAVHGRPRFDLVAASWLELGEGAMSEPLPSTEAS
jgi:hypothetical protein